MSALFAAIAECFGASSYGTTFTKHAAENDSQTATSIIDILYNAEKSGHELKQQLRNTIHTYSWTESLGKAVLSALETAIREGRAMSPALKEAHDKACEAADAVGGFVKEHPVFCTVVVLGILVLLMPWVIEAVGFAAEGPVAGSYTDTHIMESCADIYSDSFAAAWQSRYMGYVPKGSLFSFFQRLGMVWHY